MKIAVIGASETPFRPNTVVAESAGCSPAYPAKASHPARRAGSALARDGAVGRGRLVEVLVDAGGEGALVAAEHTDLEGVDRHVLLLGGEDRLP